MSREGDLTISKYVLGGARYGFLRQLCDHAFSMSNVLDGFKDSFVVYINTKGLTSSTWNSNHTRIFIRDFILSSVFSHDDLTELHSTLCDGQSSYNFDDSSPVLILRIMYGQHGLMSNYLFFSCNFFFCVFLPSRGGCLPSLF